MCISYDNDPYVDSLSKYPPLYDKEFFIMKIVIMNTYVKGYWKG